MAQHDDALIRGIDSIQLHVADLDAALAFYNGALGHDLLWRTEDAAGLALSQPGAELVIQTARPTEVDLLVEDVPAAVERFRTAGGTILRPTFEIQIGRAAVVRDPFGNELVLLDMSKGRLVTDDGGRIIGNAAT